MNSLLGSSRKWPPIKKAQLARQKNFLNEFNLTEIGYSYDFPDCFVNKMGPFEIYIKY